MKHSQFLEICSSPPENKVYQNSFAPVSEASKPTVDANKCGERTARAVQPFALLVKLSVCFTFSWLEGSRRKQKKKTRRDKSHCSPCTHCGRSSVCAYKTSAHIYLARKLCSPSFARRRNLALSKDPTLHHCSLTSRASVGPLCRRFSLTDGSLWRNKHRRQRRACLARTHRGRL